MARVKICGLKTPELVAHASRAGADWIGFVFVPASPRAVSLEAAGDLLGEIGQAKPVALLVDPDDATVDAVTGLGISILQLHGSETPERVAEIKARSGVEVWKALGVATTDDLEPAAAYMAADRLLIDAKPPKDATRTGGLGKVFDWSILSGWRAPKPWLLAGGLTPENVASAIAATGADAVDVSTGIETAPGVKDAAKIDAFIAAAKGEA